MRGGGGGGGVAATEQVAKGHGCWMWHSLQAPVTGACQRMPPHSPSPLVRRVIRSAPSVSPHHGFGSYRLGPFPGTWARGESVMATCGPQFYSKLLNYCYIHFLFRHHTWQEKKQGDKQKAKWENSPTTKVHSSAITEQCGVRDSATRKNKRTKKTKKKHDNTSDPCSFAGYHHCLFTRIDGRF